jgi:hypothetical protein
MCERCCVNPLGGLHLLVRKNSTVNPVQLIWPNKKNVLFCTWASLSTMRQKWTRCEVNKNNPPNVVTP